MSCLPLIGVGIPASKGTADNECNVRPFCIAFMPGWFGLHCIPSPHHHRIIGDNNARRFLMLAIQLSTYSCQIKDDQSSYGRCLPLG